MQNFVAEERPTFYEKLDGKLDGAEILNAAALLNCDQRCPRPLWQTRDSDGAGQEELEMAFPVHRGGWGCTCPCAGSGGVEKLAD